MSTKSSCVNKHEGHILVEVLLAMSLFVVIATAVLGGFISVRDGKVAQKQALVAKGYLDQAVEALRSVRERDWALVSINGVFHPNLNGSTWELLPNQGPEIDGFKTQIVIADILRSSTDPFGNVVPAGDIVDPASKKATITVSWGLLDRQKVELEYYLGRSVKNDVSVQTSVSDFESGNSSGTRVVNNQGGEVILANNTHARWCSPSLHSSAIDLPDGPPVAVAARASTVSVSIPNDVLAATAPTSDSSIKLAYVNVTADNETPTPSLRGIFTLDPSQGNIQTGINLDNNFKTNDVKYYTSSSGKLYALLAIDKPDKEVIAILVNDNDDSSNSEYQDFTHKIYKYQTFFNTRIYQGNTSSTPNQDQAPFGYGAVSLAVFGDRGYALSGGYLYLFNLANIDSKTPSSGLDMVGCRIQLDGYDCQPPSTTVRKYSAGQTGASWGDTSSPIHSDCSDGGNIELRADNDLDVVQVGSSIYAFIAVGGVTNPELDIANVTNVPTSSSSPRINNSSCGRISGGNSGWKRVSSLDFNGGAGTEEAANSVYAKSDGSRAYISSNGGVDANGDGNPDSYQLYVIDTTSKTAPRFLSGTSSPPTNGYYYGQNTTEANKQLYPRRSLTVLDGARAVLVGKDGVEDSNDAQEYQVLKMEGSDGEKNPQWCGGVDFDSGFNDLVSVVEADSDSFVYMVANTQEKQLKIIQGGEDGTYLPSGVFESEVFDAGPNKTVMFNRVDADVSVPSGTTLNFQIVTYGDGTQACNDITTPSYYGPDGTTAADDVFTVGGPIPYHNLPSTNINPARCFKFKVSLYADSSRDKTPTLNSLEVNYSP